MAKQSKYENDDTVSDDDKVTGIDSADGKTKNYKLSAIASFISASRVVQIASLNFNLYKHPDNTTNLRTLEIGDVILGFDPDNNFIMAKYLGGDATDFSNSSVYTIFNGI